MKTFPEGIKFKYPWRAYQKKVLDDLEEHIGDGHLHVVAPPGSGKTVLGLEAAIRLNKPTLILSPTLTIRNQWIERLCELFLGTKTVPGWISTDIRKPAFLTSVTYQGLHSACCLNSKEEATEAEEDGDGLKIGTFRNKYFEEIVRGLRDAGVGTLVIDEAHHLRNEWWNTLTKIKERLDPVTVGLTATPPYDVSHTEWKRYITLNGPIDSDIPVPELVKAGDLCPHQDYIYFSLPTGEEHEKISAYREQVHKLYEEVCGSEMLVEIFAQHPAWLEPEKNLDWIYTNFPVYGSVLIYFNSRDIPVPYQHARIVDGHGRKLKFPPMDYSRLEHLLNYLLFTQDDFTVNFEEETGALRKKFSDAGVLERKKVCLVHSCDVDKTLLSSLGKLDSIERIVESEYGSLKDGLRMVILTDYIRSEYLNFTPGEGQMSRIGVVPIFQRLRFSGEGYRKLGVLTGSLVILPEGAVSSFCEIAGADAAGAVKPYDDGYVVINMTEKLRSRIVPVVTQLFRQGGIEILIGTKALLGEGWDAPEINSLIMASFVGSFVLSNQMRGRAIRSCKTGPGKCSNIWHLVCLDRTSRDGGNDLEIMERRFKTFIGVSNQGIPYIENGIKRLGVRRSFYTAEEVEKLNSDMTCFAAGRETMKERWMEAISHGTCMVEQIKIPTSLEREERPAKLRKLYLQKTIAYLAADLGMLAGAYFWGTMDFLSRNMRLLQSSTFFYTVGLLFAGALIVLGRKTYKTVRLYIKYRDISRDVRNISEALLDTLVYENLIHTNPGQLGIKAVTDEMGAVHCHLEGATVYEQSLFADCLEQIVDVIESPRYMMERRSRMMSVFVRRDYHSVPEVLGHRIVVARYFAGRWQRHVGSCTLINTRTAEGRKKLLHARVNSLAAKLADNKVPEQINTWQ